MLLIGKAPSAPEILRVACLKFASVAGPYDLKSDMHRNGFPTWQQRNGPFWIFSSLGGRWMIGGPDEFKVQFTSETGFVASISRHGGRLPHTKRSGEWMRWDGSGWSVDDGIVIVAASRTPDVMEDLKNKRKRVREM